MQKHLQRAHKENRADTEVDKIVMKYNQRPVKSPDGDKNETLSGLRGT